MPLGDLPETLLRRSQPRIRRGEGKAPVLSEADARRILSAIDTSSVIGLREKGGRERLIESHTETEKYLRANLEAGELAGRRDAPLFQSLDRADGP